MDKLDDKDLEGIWRRVKQYIAVDRISGKNRKEVLESIEEHLNGARGAGKDPRGSINTLLKKGFATESAFGRTRTFQDNLDKWITAEPEEFEPTEFISKPKVSDIKKVKFFESGRASISTRRGKRIYAKKNLSITFSEFRGKKSYYISNTRTKKRITWGLV